MTNTATARAANVSWSLLAITAAAAALLSAATLIAWRAEAATSYNFIARAAVDTINTTNDSITATGTWADSSDAVRDIQSKRNTYDLRTADIYKWESGVKVKRTINHLRIGDEVVLQGTKSSSGKYTITRATINERSFEIVGRLKEIDKVNNTIKVLVGRSTYKHASYQNTNVTMNYVSETKCMRLGAEIGCDDLNAGSQGVKVRGTVTADRASWDLTNVWDKYPI